MTRAEWEAAVLAAADAAASLWPIPEGASQAQIWQWDEALEALTDLVTLRPYTPEE